MNSLQVTGSLSVSGQATGTASHADNSSPFFLNLAAALTSTDTGALLASKALYYADRTLSPATSETFDLTAFSSALEEAGSSMSKVRLYAIYHSSASLATSGIRVGNAATPFAGTKDTAATTDTLAVGAGFVVIVPTTTGMAVAAGAGVRVLNLDATFTATYTIGVFGE